ncbi:MAG: hypothetical protein J4N29_02015 [Chloroflexi bacterium]|nr:hypothetical protein [Chloroflexota bacterium]
MSFEGAIRELNRLKRSGVMRDFALIGAVAATVYIEPFFTEDADAVVLVDSDAEYLEVFRRVGEAAQAMQGMHYVFDGVPVQLLPTTTMPLYRDAMDGARTTRIGNMRIKVATPEHLVVMGLVAFRPKDKVRIPLLLAASDDATLDALIVRFDDGQGTLAERLRSLRPGGV